MSVEEQSIFYSIENAMKNPEKVEILDLHFKSLKRVPKEVFLFANLKELILWNNEIEDLPENLGDLPNLEKLELSGNLISKIPSSIKNLHIRLKVFRNFRKIYFLTLQLNLNPYNVNPLRK